MNTLFDDARIDPIGFASRQTNPGKKFEAVIELVLRLGKYSVETQKPFGLRPSGTAHIVDFVANGRGRLIIVSCKWQGSSGTGEDKLLWESACLSAALAHDTNYAKAYIVLGGDGWTPDKRDYFLSDRWRAIVVVNQKVQYVGLDGFIRRCFNGEL